MIELFKPKSAKDADNGGFKNGKADQQNACLLYVNTTSTGVTYTDILKCIFNGNEANEHYQVVGNNSAFIIYFFTDEDNSTIGNKLAGFCLAKNDRVTFHLLYGIQHTSYFIRDSKDVTSYVNNFFGCKS